MIMGQSDLIRLNLIKSDLVNTDRRQTDFQKQTRNVNFRSFTTSQYSMVSDKYPGGIFNNNITYYYVLYIILY